MLLVMLLEPSAVLPSGVCEPPKPAAHTLQRGSNGTVRAATPSMPDYVEHCEGATEIGKLMAEAVVREYETAAKEIEGMGAELIKCVKQCEAMTRDALTVTQEMKETAARYRTEAKRIFLQIENCTLMTAEVRNTCIEFKEKIATPPTVTA